MKLIYLYEDIDALNDFILFITFISCQKSHFNAIIVISTVQ